MKNRNLFKLQIVFVILTIIFFGCSSNKGNKTTKIAGGISTPLTYKKIIDLGMLITEDLPERIIGKATMEKMGWEKNNEFDVRYWEFPTSDSTTMKGSDTYFTLFNHAGTHVDAPNHISEEGGIDSYPLEVFIGPVKVFDISEYTAENPVPMKIFENKISAGDIVITYVNFSPSKSGNKSPGFSTYLSEEASEFLAELPVRAFCTDAASAGASHQAFLTRRIPIYEQLINVDKLLYKENMVFVGVPINIKDGDGMLVRPVVLVY